jgi:hypothetical protein
VIVTAGLHAGIAAAASSPGIATGGASSITSSSAVLHGTANPNGSATTYLGRQAPGVLGDDPDPAELHVLKPGGVPPHVRRAAARSARRCRRCRSSSASTGTDTWRRCSPAPSA